jgi:hypothetical protein
MALFTPGGALVRENTILHLLEHMSWDHSLCIVCTVFVRPGDQYH